MMMENVKTLSGQMRRLHEKLERITIQKILIKIEMTVRNVEEMKIWKTERCRYGRQKR